MRPTLILIIIILLLILYLLNSYTENVIEAVSPCHSRENFTDEKGWTILLTTCVNPMNKNDQDEIKFRTELYKTQIQKWLDNTKYHIFVVESSNNKDLISGINDPDGRLSYYFFSIDKKISSSSVGEYESIKYALKNMKENEEYKKCKYVLKVTGRYFLDGIENVINKVEKNKDMYLQIHRTGDYQNSEYFGMKKALLSDFIDFFNVNKLMEVNLYKFSIDKDYVLFGPFKNDVQRGGDKIVLTQL